MNLLPCPCCGAQLSLDALIANEDARKSLNAMLGLSKDVGVAVVKYLTLYRTGKRPLSWDSFAKKLTALMQDIKAEQIERGGQCYPAPPEAWVWAIDQMIESRNAGRLTTPIKTNGYLYEVLSKWQTAAPPRGGVGGACLERTDQDPLAPQMRPQSASKASDGMSFFRAREQALLQKINT